MLEVNNIEVVYHGVILVLKGLSLRVPGGGEIVALLGTNGAGKTTTLKAISGLLRSENGKVTHGWITFNGEKIHDKDPEEVASRGILQVMEGRRIFEHLTVKENLLAGAHGCKNRAEIALRLETVLHYFPRLAECLNRTSGYLSGGEQQMLVIGRALMGNPKLLLLDEPSLGLSPILVREIFEIVQTIAREQKASILLVEQNAALALDIATYGYVMEDGRVVLDGPSESLKENPDIREFYMGLSSLGKKSYRDVKHYKRRKRWLG
ncbi:MAG: ABC transporter ATP-binding protein [Deltaproteobacteria bacterium]|nr:MAG: ABC transporter ATP-binding protein [Deltaproteobacteria bacterium]